MVSVHTGIVYSKKYPQSWNIFFVWLLRPGQTIPQGQTMKSRDYGSEYATDISRLTLPQGRRDFKNKRQDCRFVLQQRVKPKLSILTKRIDSFLSWSRCQGEILSLIFITSQAACATYTLLQLDAVPWQRSHSGFHHIVLVKKSVVIPVHPSWCMLYVVSIYGVFLA
jgi:hypothetical protein